MKKLGKLKLNQLSSAELNEQEMNTLRGGSGSCCCGCGYAGSGGSSSSSNSSANSSYGYSQSYGGDCGGSKDFKALFNDWCTYDGCA